MGHIADWSFGSDSGGYLEKQRKRTDRAGNGKNIGPAVYSGFMPAVYVYGMYGPAYDAAQFIYFQF